MKRFTYIPTSLLITAVGLLLLTPLLAGITPSDGTSNFTSIAHAQDNYEFLAPIGGFGDEIDVSSEDSFPQYVQTVITMTIGFAILAAIILIIMAGFQYMTTTSKGGVDQAKERIRNAILGLILALASVVILQTINPNLVELNSVQTVTTSGSSFAEIDPSLMSFNGEVYLEEDREHGDQWCFYVSGTVEVFDAADFLGADWSSDDNRYICYNTEGECSENQQSAQDILNEHQAYEEVDRVDECKYYFESTGQVVTKGEDSEVVVSDVIGIGSNKDAATDNCESRARYEVENNSRQYEQCVRDIDSAFDSENCEIQCDEPEDMPVTGGGGGYILSFPDGSFQQFNSLSACEAKEMSGDASGDCYEATPENIFQRNILSPPNNGESVIRSRLSEAQQIGDTPTVEYVPPMTVNKGPCNSVGDSDCTNVGGLSPAAMEGLRDLNEDVTESCRDGSSNYQEGCSLRVTGGTEWWLHGNKEEDPFASIGDTAHHPVGLGNGVRTGAVDLGFQNNLNSYVEDNYDPVGQTDKDYSIYSVNGNQFIKEPSHWHVQFSAY